MGLAQNLKKRNSHAAKIRVFHPVPFTNEVKWVSTMKIRNRMYIVPNFPEEDSMWNVTSVVLGKVYLGGHDEHSRRKLLLLLSCYKNTRKVHDCNENFWNWQDGAVSIMHQFSTPSATLYSIITADVWWCHQERLLHHQVAGEGPTRMPTAGKFTFWLGRWWIWGLYTINRNNIQFRWWLSNSPEQNRIGRMPATQFGSNKIHQMEKIPNNFMVISNPPS